MYASSRVVYVDQEGWRAVMRQVCPSQCAGSRLVVWACWMASMPLLRLPLVQCAFSPGPLPPGPSGRLCSGR